MNEFQKMDQILQVSHKSFSNAQLCTREQNLSIKLLTNCSRFSADYVVMPFIIHTNVKYDNCFEFASTLVIYKCLCNLAAQVLLVTC